MTAPIPNLPDWDGVRVFGRWRNYDGTLKAGTYEVRMPARVIDTPDDSIIPAGVFKTGNLNTVPLDSPWSLDLVIPTASDPDISTTGGNPILTVKFADGAAAETYVLDLPLNLVGDATGVNLREVLTLAGQPPAQLPALIRGVPGGVAGLDVDGDVIDASGAKVVGGTGGGGTPTTDAGDLTSGTLDPARLPAAYQREQVNGMAGVNSQGKLYDIRIPDRLSDATLAGKYVASTTIRTVLQLTQAAYDALPVKDPNTLYITDGAGSGGNSPIENVNTVTASGAAQTLPDVTTATIHSIKLTANCTLTFPTAAAGKSFTLILTQDATGGRAVTWPAGIKWPAGTAPTLSTAANKVDVLSFLANATVWDGFVAGLDIR